MKLPYAEHVGIDQPKLLDYLLSPEHPVGRFKAQFFAQIGFNRGNWQELAAELRRIAVEGEAVTGQQTSHGQKYIVRGTVTSRFGKSAEVVTVWIVLNGGAFPRLVTVYPE